MAQASPDTDDPKVVAFPGRAAADGTERSEDIPAPGVCQAGDAARPVGQTACDMFNARGDQRVGPCLRGIREARGLELSDVARQLCLNSAYLMAIERMEVGTIPPGYLTPYLRNYAGVLGLPADDVVEAYTAECGATRTVTRPQPIVTEDTPDRPLWRHPLLIGAIAITLSVSAAYALWPEDALSPVPAANGERAPLHGARESLFAGADLSALPGQVETLPLMLTATRDAWIEVRGADGTIFRSRAMSAGETYYPRIGAGWTVTARDGGAFEWRVGDAVIGPLGPEGTAVFAASVDAAARNAAKTVAPALAASADTPRASQ